MENATLTDTLLAECDVVVVLTDHSAVDYARVVERSKCVLDTRNATKKVTEGREKIVLL
jgi:UDP-N-acetyl-D-glucosamine dehydrogenase